MSKAIEKFAESAGGPIGIGIAVVTVVAVVWSVWGKSIKEAAAAVGNKVNPASDKNLVYDNLIGGVGRSLSGDDSWSLGGWIYDLTHKEFDPNEGTPSSGTFVPRSNQVKEEAAWYERLIGK